MSQKKLQRVKVIENAAGGRLKLGGGPGFSEQVSGDRSEERKDLTPGEEA